MPITTPEEANATWKQANEFYDKGDFQAAIQLYTMLLESEVGVDRLAIKEARAMACCKVGLYEQAERDLGELLDMLRRFRPDVSGSRVMYWYLVARYRGDEKKAMDEWLGGSLS